MAKTNPEGVLVSKVKNGDGKRRARSGKPRKIATGSMMSEMSVFKNYRLANYGGGGLGGANTIEGYGGNFYSPELSTDFLELPQSLHEQWNYYRFFYKTDPFVGQALDLHDELPLSKVRIAPPKARSRDIAVASTRFCERWAQRIGLLQRLLSVNHERNLIGEVFVWLEDANPEMPQEIRQQLRRVLTTDGEAREEWADRQDADERAARWLRRNYKGWTGFRCLPPEQVRMESFNFTDERIFSLVPDSKTKAIIERAKQGDKDAIRVVESMPEDVVAAVIENRDVPLNTDPYAGSFVHYIARRKSDYDTRGHSLLERNIRTLVYRDKLRQAQTSIASRHMTPIRIVYGENLNDSDVEALREQVDMALQDPDYSIIANFEVRWEEMGADQRLLDLGTEYDLTDRQLYAGLGVTEGLLSGESAYSGDRINLEVINTRYMLLREQLQEFIQEYVFKPMCSRMGFIEEDEDGEPVVVIPTLSFTRLALRDNRDTFDTLYNLYTKGSLDIETILEYLNLDPVAVRERLEKDLFTVNDANFNEALRSVYSDGARLLVSEAGLSDAADKIADAVGLKYTPPKKDEGDGRF